jgi:hypothetical protein
MFHYVNEDSDFCYGSAAKGEKRELKKEVFVMLVSNYNAIALIK